MSERLNEQTWTHEGRPALHYAGCPAKAGPWWDEPDKIQWVDGETDLDCLMVRNPLGVWCGYVGVPPEHPLHGADYAGSTASVYGRVSVHGDLTFAGPCQEGEPKGHGICHVAGPGREDDVWWLGFDCAHGWDLIPSMSALGQSFSMSGTYKDVSYVQQECAQLAAQLHAIRVAA